MLEVQVALILAALAAVTLAALIVQQTRISARIAGPFGAEQWLYLVKSSDPLIRQLGLPADVLTSSPGESAETSPPTTAEIEVISVDVDGVAISVLADFIPPTNGGGS